MVTESIKAWHIESKRPYDVSNMPNIQLLQAVACRRNDSRPSLDPVPVSPYFPLDLTGDSMLDWMMLRPQLGGP